MDLDKLREKLLDAARANVSSDAVPYGFEKRIMARVAEEPALDPWSLWNRILWRATAPCLAMMLLLGVWTFLAPDRNHSDDALAADLESAVFAAFDEAGETW